MKKTISLLNAVIVLLVTSFTGCNDLAKKSNKENNAVEKTSQIYLEDIEHYRKETKKTIDSNSQKIIEYKVKMESTSEAYKYDYRNAILELELQNSYMKMKLDAYAPKGKADWENFKTEYTCQLIELNKEFTRFSDLNFKNKYK